MHGSIRALTLKIGRQQPQPDMADERINRKDTARQSRNQNLEQKKTKGTKIPFAESPFSPLPPVQILLFAFRLARCGVPSMKKFPPLERLLNAPFSGNIVRRHPMQCRENTRFSFSAFL